MLYVIAIVSALALATSVITLIAAVKNSKRAVSGADSATNAKLEAESKAIRESVRESVGLTNEATVNALKSGMTATNEQVISNVRELTRSNESRLKEVGDKLESGLKDVKTELTSALEKVRADNQTQLEKVRADNALQLDKIRGTVDEKLSKTLDEKLQASFNSVNAILEKVYKNLGELKSLDSGITELNKVLGGAKSRGTWGEISLEALLAEVLAPSQYEVQSRLGKRGEGLRVDCAVILPGSDGDKVYLPIDSKFPVEDFNRMNDALNAGDMPTYNTCRAELRDRIKRQVTEVKKYISPPATTDFAIMFLPTESLYAEVLRLDGLAESVQRESRILIAGPANLCALLNSLRMGFRTLQVQKNSREIMKLFEELRKDFDVFAETVDKASRKMDEVQQAFRKSSEYTDKMKKRITKAEGLNVVEELPGETD